MSVTAAVIIPIISSILRQAPAAYDAAKRLSAEGYEVPGLDEYEAETDRIANLPKLDTGEGESEGGE